MRATSCTPCLLGREALGGPQALLGKPKPRAKVVVFAEPARPQEQALLPAIALRGGDAPDEEDWSVGGSAKTPSSRRHRDGDRTPKTPKTPKTPTRAHRPAREGSVVSCRSSKTTRSRASSVAAADRPQTAPGHTAEPPEAAEAAHPDEPPAVSRRSGRRGLTWAPAVESGAAVAAPREALSQRRARERAATATADPSAARPAARHTTWAPGHTHVLDVHSVCSPRGTEARSPASTGESCASSRRSPPSRSRLVSPLDVSKGTFAYIQGEMIGRGAYGCVYKALDSETGQIFVVKEVALDMGSKEDNGYRERLMDELEICQNVSHKNVVSYLGHEHDDSHVRIFLEYVAGGPMTSVLREFGPLRGTLMKMAARGTLEGLNYLHSRSPPIVHRDIKGANVLVDLSFCVRLADFGCSKRDEMTMSYTMLGSIPWMAPEVIQREGGHGRKADIWSLGCTLIEFASAERPWGNSKFDNNPVFAMWHIGASDATPPIPDSAADDERELISRCVQRSPDDRPWTEELLQMSFVA